MLVVCVLGSQHIKVWLSPLPTQLPLCCWLGGIKKKVFIHQIWERSQCSPASLDVKGGVYWADKFHQILRRMSARWSSCLRRFHHRQASENPSEHTRTPSRCTCGKKHASSAASSLRKQDCGGKMNGDSLRQPSMVCRLCQSWRGNRQQQHMQSTCEFLLSFSSGAAQTGWSCGSGPTKFVAGWQDPWRRDTKFSPRWAALLLRTNRPLEKGMSVNLHNIKNV